MLRWAAVLKCWIWIQTFVWEEWRVDKTNNKSWWLKGELQMRVSTRSSFTENPGAKASPSNNTLQLTLCLQAQELTRNFHSQELEKSLQIYGMCKICQKLKLLSLFFENLQPWFGSAFASNVSVVSWWRHQWRHSQVWRDVWTFKNSCVVEDWCGWKRGADGRQCVRFLRPSCFLFQN